MYEWRLVRHYFDKCGLFWMSSGKWGIILGEWGWVGCMGHYFGWMGVNGGGWALFWVGGGGSDNILGGWCGWR